ncbi:MAG TPA: ADOP family duplicated permease [Vicinamibacteria bacterium]|nr:ADOP family duplicated permease [Vicinamibacteria bacterium]
MDTLLQDLRHAFRLLRRSPGFTAAAVATLALGMGANTAMFSVVHAVMLRPLPYAEPERLVRIRGGSSWPDLDDLKAQGRTLGGLGGYRAHSLDLVGGPVAERVLGAAVTGDLFRTLRVPPALGHAIGPEDDRPNGERVVVLSHAFWRGRLAGDPDVPGRTLRFSSGVYRVLGVMPPGFRLPGLEAEVFVPLAVESPSEAGARGAHTLAAVARLAPGASIALAQAELDAIAARLAAAYPEENTDRRYPLSPLHGFLVRDIRDALLLLLGAVFLVLLIAATNVANLLLVRAASREREMAVRASLGAGRARLLRQLLAESVLLAALGGAAGLVVALWLVGVVVRLAPPQVPGLDGVSLDLRVLAFTGGVAVLTGLLFGLAPGLHGSRVPLADSLKEGARTGTGRPGRRVRDLLVVSQVALALVLLVGAGLLLRSLHRLQSVDPGFEPSRLVTFNLTLPTASYGDIPKRNRFFEQVLERVAALPGVTAAGATSELPFASGGLTPHDFIVEGRPPLRPGTEPELSNRAVTPAYFETVGLPLRRGRLLDESDRADAPLVGVVNEAAAREHFSGEDPLGRRVAWARADELTWITVVGVVGDVRGTGLDESDAPALYTPLAQELRWWKSWKFVSGMLFGVRPTDPATFLAVAAILTAVAALACYRPARRAARADPLAALRAE